MFVICGFFVCDCISRGFAPSFRDCQFERDQRAFHTLSLTPLSRMLAASLADMTINECADMALLLPIVTTDPECGSHLPHLGSFRTTKFHSCMLGASDSSTIPSLLVFSTQRPHLLCSCAFMYTYDTTTVDLRHIATFVYIPRIR